MIGMKVTRTKKHDPIAGMKKGYINGLDSVLIALQEQAADAAPFDAGFLKASIQKKRKGSEGYIYTNLSYAAAQELGTNKMEAANEGRGYMSLAADIIRNQLDNIFKVAMKKAFRSS